MKNQSRLRRLFAPAVLVFFLVGAPSANAAKKDQPKKDYDPHITYLFPAGGQRGTTVKTMIRGRGLEGAGEVRISGKGVAGKILAIEKPDTKLQQRSKNRQDTSDNPNVVRLEVTIAPDAELGERDLRLVTPKGVTNRFRFIVGQLAEVNEIEPNEDTSAPQSLPSLPVQVNGQVFQGDRDVFRFAAKAGQTLVLDVHAQKLLPYIADAVPGWLQSCLTLYDSAGKELAFVDDYRFHPDPVMIYNVKQDGEYMVEIKDVLYRGREDLIYRLAIGELPFITHIFPLGGKRDSETQVELHGVNLPAESMKLTLPGDGPPVHYVQVDHNGLTSNALPLAVGDTPELAETEPNDSPEQANKIEAPVTVNGRIGRSGDADYFTFTVEAKQKLVIDVRARRLASPLDSIVTLFDSRGRRLVENDDTVDAAEGLVTHQADSRVEYTFAAAGDYVLRIRDVQGQGGDEYTYRLTVAAPRPDFALRIVPDNPSVHRGGNAVVKVKAFRRDSFGGPIHLAVKNLPAGCVASQAEIGAKQNEVRLTVTAAGDAPLGVFSPGVEGTAEIGEQTVVREAAPSEDLMQAFIYWHNVPSKDFLFSVVPSGRCALALEAPPEKPLEVAQGGNLQVVVKASRAEGVKGAVTLTADTPPKGVTVKRAVIPADKDQATVTITVTKQAAVGLTDNIILHGTLKAGPQTITCVAPAVPIRVVDAKK